MAISFKQIHDLVGSKIVIRTDAYIGSSVFLFAADSEIKYTGDANQEALLDPHEARMIAMALMRAAEIAESQPNESDE